MGLYIPIIMPRLLVPSWVLPIAFEASCELAPDLQAALKVIERLSSNKEDNK